MLRTITFLVALACLHCTALGQSDLRVLRANSPVIDVKDGERLLKGEWIVDPTLPLDVFDARRSVTAKTVTFISDIDSLSFDVEPNHTYDFIVLLNGKDACKTRISTMTQSAQRIDASATGPVSIPITISKGKLHVRGTIGTSAELDLIFDTGSNANLLYPSAIEKGATFSADGAVNNSATGGSTMRQLSRDNQIEIGGLRWTHESVLYIDKQADSADGLVGYPLFEDKVVELDFDRMLLIIHDTLPAHAATYAKTPMPFLGSLPAVETTFKVGSNSESGLLALDTGGSGTVIVNPAFAAAHRLRDSLKSIGSSESRGLGSATIKNDLVLAPELVIAGITLKDVPINAELPREGDNAPAGGVLCMEVLQRFNTVLDFPGNAAYFKQNTLFDAPYRNRSSSGLPLVAATIGSGVALSLGLVAVFRLRGKKDAAKQQSAAA